MSSLSALLPRSFRSQLALSFALLGASLGLVLALALGSLLARSSRADAALQLNTAATHAARLLADGMSLRLREVRILAESPTLWSDGLASARVAQALYRSQALNPYSAWIGIADVEGVVLIATGQLLVGQSVAARPWFQAGLKAPFVGDVHPAKLLARMLPVGSDGAPQRFVDFAAPIHRDGRLVGVLGIHGSWDWTQATIESLLPEAGERRGVEVMVFDAAGRMIYAPQGTLDAHLAAGQKLPAPSPAQAQAPPRRAAAVLRWADGADYLTSQAAMPRHGNASDLGWTVVVRQPTAAAHAAARRATGLALLLGLAAALLAALLGRGLAVRLTRPLRAMVRDARALDPAGSLPAWPQHRGSLEVEQLSQALGSMTRGLVEANAQLEQRVAERTTALEAANLALSQLAAHDPLTGLLNRRGLEERLVAAVASARRRQSPVSLLLVDADHFKRVNDQYGHEVGDQVLQAIARCLQQRLRAVDVVARIGGEEFVVLLPDTAGEGAAHVASALVDAVRASPMPVVGQITVSCGVAEMAIQGETAEAVLRRADAALYQAKHAGRNRHCVAAMAAAAASHAQPEPEPAGAAAGWPA